MTKRQHPDSTVIDLLGGTNKVAAICDIKPPSVSEWRKNGIPDGWRRFFELRNPEVFEKATAGKPTPKRQKAVA